MIGFSWNIYMYFFQPEATEFVLDKETTSWANRHVKPFFFYLHFPVYIGIWCMPVVASFFYKYAAPRVNKYGNYKFTLFWMLFSIFLLSVIPTKKERYLLPAMIPMSLTAAYLIYALIQKFRLNNEGKWDKVFFSIFSLIIGVGLILLPFAILIFYSASYTALSIVTAFIIACIGVAILWYWKSKKADRVVGLSILAVCVFCLGLIPKAADWFYHYDEFKPLTEIRSFEELEEVDFYTELDEIDPRLVWMIGKHSRPVSSISLKEESNYPLVMVSLSPLEHFISRPNILDSLKITDYGIYDMNRKNSKWKARVHLLELKSE